MKNESKEEKSKKISEAKAGDTVKVYEKIPVSNTKSSSNQKGGNKEKIHIFEGVVLARKHGNEPGATITVRRMSSGIGVERIFPLHSPLIKKIEVVKKGKVRRAKLYYLRKAIGKKAKIKEKK